MDEISQGELMGKKKRWFFRKIYGISSGGPPNGSIDVFS
jgi:hypothetical protein